MQDVQCGTHAGQLAGTVVGLRSERYNSAMFQRLRAAFRTPVAAPVTVPPGPTLQQLPGYEHARYALPLEYPPSRDLKPRWGFGRPPIEPLYAWFMEHAEGYRAFLARMRAYGPELADVPRHLDPVTQALPAWGEDSMSPIDSLALYSFVRDKRPKTYLEIGSGMTTSFAHLARQRGGTATRIVSIDPEPRAAIDALCDHVERCGLESCDLAIFDQLEAGDIVFMDGSHRSFMNSDVTVFFIDVLPRLKPGVLVHLHDITLPVDYSSGFVKFYWNEQYMLAVYLMGNRARIVPLLPTALITSEPAFAADIAAPFVETAEAMPWNGGGSMWFTHV
jgi:predicted O-methyltransferase YrrM